MPPRITFDTVRKLGLALPDVEEGSTYGSPALKIRGHLLACMTSHTSAEPNSLAVRVGFEQRDELIAAEPDTYYVRLSRIHRDALRDLLQTAWRVVSASASRRRRR